MADEKRKTPAIRKDLLALLITGIAIAVAAFSLTAIGNPKNMGFCIACFIRDIAGAMRFHSAAPVQYLRPEIPAIVLGAFALSIVKGEFKPRGGSSPVLRLLIGAGVMISALVFLGCPLRMIIRMSGGDLNAYVAFVGFVAGIWCATKPLSSGFSLGRVQERSFAEGLAVSALQAVLAVLALFASGLFAFSQSGPGSMHAPFIASFSIAIVIGALCQFSRVCCAGGIRDVFLMRDWTLFAAPLCLFITLLALNLLTGNASFSFSSQPVAHQDHVWNFLSMFAVGFGSVLLGGCPLRQLILAGEGNCDSFLTVLGMFMGAAISHNFGLSGIAGQGATMGGKVAVCVIIAFFACLAAFNAKENGKAA